MYPDWIIIFNTLTFGKKESEGNATTPAGTAKVDVSLYIHSPESGTTPYADNFVCTVFGPTAGKVAR